MIPRRRLWLYRGLVAWAAPVLFVVVVELVLRLAGFGHPMGFAVRQEVRGAPAVVSNPYFTWPFFGPGRARDPVPFALAPVRADGTLRIVITGGSAAQGDPDFSFSLARLLEVMLEDRYPGVSFEVINAGITAINSNVVLPIARACPDLDADLVVVYLGNNEVVGPYGAASRQGPLASRPAFIRLGLAVARSRLGQLAMRVLAGLTVAGGGEPAQWEGMEGFLDTRIRARDSALMHTYDLFARNLEEIRDGLGRAGIPLILCTVPVNLRDCPPFASLHREDMDPAGRDELDRLLEQGEVAERAGEVGRAVEPLRRALALDPEHAEAHFRLARCLWRLGNHEQARQHYELARDHDVLRFRADSRINQIIRRVANERDAARLLDLEQELSALSPGGVAGEELFYDHVHLNFAGTHAAARAVLGEVAHAAPQWVRSSDSGSPPLDEAECARRVAYTGWSRYRIAVGLLDRLQRPPFTFQLDHGEAVAAAIRRVEELRDSTRGEQLQEVLAEYRQAMAGDAEDWLLHYDYAFLQLEALADPAVAVRHFREVVDRLPTFTHGHANLAEALLLLGRDAEAAASLRIALEHKPLWCDGWISLGLALARQAEVEDASRCFERAVAIDPDSDSAHFNLAQTILQLAPDSARARQRGVGHLRRALELNPGNERARQALEHFDR